MRDGFVPGMIAGGIIGAALFSMYMGQNPSTAAKMSRKVNKGMRDMMDRMNVF